MRHQHNSSDSIGRSTRRVAGAVAVLAMLSLVSATSASAAFEQVGTFGASGEGQQLTQASGAAINLTGAGGVAPGTVYTDSRVLNRVLVYGPKGEFEAAWGWKTTSGEAGSKYERCGPAGEPGKQCDTRQGSPQGEGVGQVTAPVGIAVDQKTGDVYVLSDITLQRDHHLILVFTAEGQPIGEGFGDKSVFGETFAESPEAIHEGVGIAVDATGTIYVSDRKGSTPESPSEEARVMSFKPTIAGNYESYAYTGRSNDLSTGKASGPIALDDAGDLYLGTEEKIYEYPPSPASAPSCQFKIPSSGGRGLTVNPQSGEVFYYDYKGRRGHQLSACNGEGAFTELGQFEVLPKTEQVSSLAFNPDLEWDSTRPPGLLYAIDSVEPGLGHIYAPPPAIAPVVEAESVGSVASTSAVLKAQVNPKGSSTHYVFQYISSAAYEANGSEPFSEASEAPLGGGVIAPGQNGVSVVASLVGLQPDEEYHYRVIATSHCNHSNEAEVCEDVGADQVLETFPVSTARLPDNRAYELVSPAEKHAAEVIPLEPEHGSCTNETECKPGVASQPFPRQFSLDGDAIVYEGFAFSPREGAALYNEYTSRRTEAGWQTENLSPTLLASSRNGYKAFSPDLAESVILQEHPSLTSSAPLGFSNLYAQPTATPLALEALIDGTPPNRTSGAGASPLSVVYVGASADLSHVFFEANDALTEATAFAPEATDGGFNEYNLYEWSGGQLRLVNVAPGNAATAPGAEFGSGLALSNSSGRAPLPTVNLAISTDGSRIFWTASSGRLYVRTDAASTEEIPDPGKFLTAASEGSAVLLSDGHIYDLETASTTDLTEGHGGFLGILGQSEDLSRVYFVDSAVLTGAERNAQGAEAEAGENNLYLRSGERTSFITKLSPTISPAESADSEDWRAAAALRPAEASPNGNWLTFLSASPLTGHDVGACGEKGTDCREVFLYDAATEELTCASCNRSGAAPLGRSYLPFIGQAEAPLGQPSYLTDAGRLFFDSKDSLTPLDTNGGVEDVYEYEPSGVGSCEQGGGCVSLISAGSGTSDSNFLAMDPSGKNVAFTTRDRLLEGDKDELVDVYDAREGGGSASSPDGSGSECSGESCQSASSLTPEAVPGSLAFSGAGNLLVPVPAGPVTKPKPLTKAQKLAKALRACKQKQKKKRSACERAARKRYGEKAKAKKALTGSSGGKS